MRHCKLILIKLTVNNAVKSYNKAFRTPLAGEDIAFKNPMRHYLETAADYSRRLVRHHLRDGSATDNYLNRTKLVNGEVIYTSHYDNENNGEWSNALESHYAKVKRDIDAFRLVKNK